MTTLAVLSNQRPLVRVDARLVHGQVIGGWVPFLRLQRLIVADDAAAADALGAAAMRLAAPPGVAIEIVALAECRTALERLPVNERTLVLFASVDNLCRACAGGLRPARVMIGVLPAGAGRVCVTPSVYLSRDDIAALYGLETGGIPIEIRSVPTEMALTTARAGEIVQRGAAS